MLKGVVQQFVDKGFIKLKAIIVDSTHTIAFSQKKRPFEVLREAASRLVRAVKKKHPKLKTKLPSTPECSADDPDAVKTMLHHLAELGETIESLLPDHEGSISEKLQIAKQIVEDQRLLANKGAMSAIDPDARFGWKSNTKSFFGYKEHIAITEEEIITALEVTGGSTDDGKQLPILLEKTQANGLDVKEVIADTAYSGKDNLQRLSSQDIEAIIPLNPIVHTGGCKQDGFDYNKDADFVVCPAGQHSIRKAIQGKKEEGRSRSLVYFFDVEKCKVCPFQEGCYKPGSKTKTFSIRLVAEQLQKQMNFESTEQFKERIKRRPIIEHKNAELKRFHGLTRAKYRGLFGIRIQAILTAFAVNVKRMIKLQSKMEVTSC